MLPMNYTYAQCVKSRKIIFYDHLEGKSYMYLFKLNV